MIESMQSWYPWCKSLHIIALVCWFAGLFYLPRLYVYHTMSSDHISLERFSVMERKLYYGIMWPSMVLTWFFGVLTLVINYKYYLSMPWMHIKLSLVLLLTLYHVWCGYTRKQLLVAPHQHSHVYYRWLNELPVVFLIAIVLLVVVKPQF